MSLLLTQIDPSMPLLLVSIIGGYLSGSVPYGLILTRMAGLGDIRKVGSGNIGATNVLRAGGKKLAIITLILDALKGVIPVLVAKQVHMDYAVLAGLAAFFGHLFPVWLKFKGGKGVATSLGVMLALWWQLGVCMLCIWVLVFMISKYSSLSALIAFAAAPILAAVLSLGNYQLTAVSFIIAIMVFIRHHENIRRLINGTESKSNIGKKSPA